MRKSLRIGGWSVYPAEGLLVRGGERMHLRPKAMDLLQLLAAHSGQTVDKETLLRSVWPDTIVADGGLAHCVSELRAALGDDPRQPRFIETVPRRGYRLITRAETLEGDAARPPLGDSRPGTGEPPAVAAAAARGKRLPWPALAALALVAIALTGWALGGRSVIGESELRPDSDPILQPSAAAPRTVVLSFANLSGDPDADWLGDALPFLLTAELATTTHLSPVPWDVVAGLAADMPSGEVASPSAAVLRRLQGNLGVDRVISGHFSLSAAGSRARPRFEITVTDAGSGMILGSVEAQGRGDRLGELVSRLAHDLGKELGWGSLPTDRTAAGTFDDERWLEEFFRGRRALTRYETEDARELLERAAETSDSPWPFLALAELRSHTGHRDQAARDVDSALARTDRLSREERLWIEAKGHALADRWTPVIERLQALRLAAPSNLQYELRRVFSYLAAGRVEEAEAAGAEVLARAPFATEEPRWRFLTGEIYLALGRHDAALAEAGEAIRLARQLDVPGIEGRALYLEARARAAAGQSREALDSLETARRRFASADELPYEAAASNLLADWLTQIGDNARAEEAARNALDVSRRAGDHAGEAEALRLLGYLAWKNGRRKAGEGALRQALEILRHTGARAEQAGVWTTLADAVGRFTDAPARSYLESALEIYRELGDREQSTWMLYRLGRESLRETDLDGALEALNGAEKTADALQPVQRARLMLLLGHARLWAGEMYDARAVIEVAANLFRQAGNGTRLAVALEHLAFAEMHEADLDSAARYQEESVSLLEELDAPVRLANSRQGLARILLEAGDLEAAERLARQAVEQTGQLSSSAEVRSLAIEALALVQLESGSATEAQATLAELTDQAVSEMSFIGLKCALTRARALAAGGQPRRARELLDALSEHLESRGPRLLQIEARLERLRLIRSQEELPDPLRVERLAGQARSQGLMLLAGKAEALLSS